MELFSWDGPLIVLLFVVLGMLDVLRYAFNMILSLLDLFYNIRLLLLIFLLGD